MKNKVSFTFDEVILLSEKIGFSIDYVINSVRSKHYTRNSEDLFMETFQIYYDLFKKFYSAQNSEMIVSMNQIWVQLIPGYEYIFKYYYFKWLYQFEETPCTLKFSGVVFSPELVMLKKKYFNLFKLPDNNLKITYIVDNNVYKSTFEELQYYYRRGLISYDELSLIKKDFYNLLDISEQHTKVLNTQAKCYISVLDINSNEIYINYDENSEIIISFSSMFPFRRNEPDVCKAQRQKLDMMISNSILFSEGNYLFQEKYYNRQREYLNNIDKNDHDLINIT